mmetsp:Transcript_11417/g.19278  ORF Transcript_11417/g.19278 Transcript_11417/m.19278 type:complete len:126 (+) Transcript_11417:1350-1727(+)
MSEYPDDADPNQYLNMAAEELSSENRKNAQSLISFFGEEVVKGLFSKTWQLREEALTQIESLVVNKRSGLSKEEAFLNAIGAVRFTILDKMAGVSHKSMFLMSSVCREFPNLNLDGGQRSQLTQY